MKLRRMGPALILLGLFLLPACSLAPKPAPTPVEPPGRLLSDAAASRLLADLRRTNTDLTTFMASAKASLTDGGQTHHFPVTAVGQAPDRLRLVILTPLRSPAETLATDGRMLYMRSHTGRHPFHKTAATEEALQGMLAIELSAAELVALLRGRVPLAPHSGIALRQNPDSGALALTLRSAKDSAAQKIFLTPDKEVYKVETYTIKGSLAWRATFSGTGDSGKFRLPDRITISDDDTALSISIGRYRANVNVLPQAFVLEP